jgi:hypothetical protein
MGQYMRLVWVGRFVAAAMSTSEAMIGANYHLSARYLLLWRKEL